MADDIVTRLRAIGEQYMLKGYAFTGSSKPGEIYLEAADEIESLRAYKRRQAEDIMTLGQQIGQLEAQLAKVDYDLGIGPKPQDEQY